MLPCFIASICMYKLKNVLEWPTVKNHGNSLFFHLSLIKIRGERGGGLKVQGCDIRGVLQENHYLILRIFLLKFFKYIIYFLDLK